MAASDIIYCRARVSETQLIKDFIDSFFGEGVDPRPSEDIISTIRDFFLAKMDGRIVGCISVHLHNEIFAQLRSLAVDPKCWGKGIGSRLIELALYDAKIMGAKKAFGFSKIPDFLGKFKFRKAKASDLPKDKCLKMDRCHSCSSGYTPLIIGLDKISYVIKY